VSEVIDVKEASAWYQGALGELYAVLAAHKVTPAGPGGAIYANDLFSYARGETTVFVPCGEPVRATGRISRLVVPEVELPSPCMPAPTRMPTWRTVRSPPM